MTRHARRHAILGHACKRRFAEEDRGMHMAAAGHPWTLAELERLPDDGNKYEIIDGELFVTPPPSPEHEVVLIHLNELLVPHVAKHGLGAVFRPRAVIRSGGSEAEPDLFVCARPPRPGAGWEDLPPPLLVVEVLSPTTRRRDLVAKRDFYLAAGSAEYWIIDPDERALRRVRAGRSDDVEHETFNWEPGGGLMISVPDLFRSAEQPRSDA
jgi:Uma2 family endonuclease